MSSFNITGVIIGSGTALTSLNYNAILNPPALVSFNPSTFVSKLNISGNTTLNNATTCMPSLNVSGIIIFNGASTHVPSLNVSGVTTSSNNIIVMAMFHVLVK